jgi:hypothetical protein
LTTRPSRSENAQTVDRSRRFDVAERRARAPDGEVKLTSRFVFVISREQPQLHEYVRRAFSREADVRVIVDRRVTTRRHQAGSHVPDRRRTERRVRTEIEAELKARGSALVAADPSKDPEVKFSL